VFEKVPGWWLGRVDADAVIKDAIEGGIEHDTLGLAAEITYHAALTVLPLLLTLAALPGFVHSVFDIPDVGQRIADEADQYLSANSAAMVRAIVDQVARTSGWTPITIGVFGTIVTGISSTSTIRKSLNRIYGYEEVLPFFERKLIELGITLAAGSLIFLAFLAVLLGPLVLTDWRAGAEVLSILLAFSCVLLAVAVIYWLSPANENTFRWVTPGALLFGFTWIALSLLFSAYLSHFGTLNRVYGSLGAMIALLVWLYWSNLTLLAGAEINAALGRQADPKVQAAERTTVPYADGAASDGKSRRDGQGESLITG